MRKLVLAASAASLMVPAAVVPVAPAAAQSYGTYKGKIWRDHQGRYRCKKPNGTTGLLVGGAAGALAGRAIDTRGDRATGTILGAAVGALLGRHVERNVVSKCR